MIVFYKFSFSYGLQEYQHHTLFSKVPCDQQHNHGGQLREHA